MILHRHNMRSAGAHNGKSPIKHIAFSMALVHGATPAEAGLTSAGGMSRMASA